MLVDSVPETLGEVNKQNTAAVPPKQQQQQQL
jgi:hypothetical protein